MFTRVEKNEQKVKPKKLKNDSDFYERAFLFEKKKTKDIGDKKTEDIDMGLTVCHWF